MKLKILPYFVFIFVLVGCSAFQRSPNPYPKMNLAFIPDDRSGTLDNDSSMEDIALSFPMFEQSVDDVKASIANKDAQVLTSPNTWRLEGDGAQLTVEVSKESKPDDPELEVKVKVHRSYPVDKTWTSKFRRSKDGWINLGAG